jgi:hypothetical protein
MRQAQIMTMNSPIKIIKRAERERQREARVAKRLASASQLPQEKARDAATTITGWISELRQQKQQSAVPARIFKSLFGDTT